jgi:hypothetical protein
MLYSKRENRPIAHTPLRLNNYLPLELVVNAKG